MTSCGDWPVAICSWSLKQDLDGVIETIGSLGVDYLHLALRPALGEGRKRFEESLARARNVTISCAMIDFPSEDYSTLQRIRETGGVAPDSAWPENRLLFEGAVALAAELAVPRLSMHAGFIDHGDPEYCSKFYSRILELADMAQEKGVELLMETGQESAAELVRFLEEMDHPALFVNIDPANMILYDKDDPVDAVCRLAPWIRHVHIKDAVRTASPGTWGAEVAWGEGQVGGERFLNALKGTGYRGAVAVEREAGDDRINDIRLAVERLSRFTT